MTASEQAIRDHDVRRLVTASAKLDVIVPIADMTVLDQHVGGTNIHSIRIGRGGNGINIDALDGHITVAVLQIEVKGRWILQRHVFNQNAHGLVQLDEIRS